MRRLGIPATGVRQFATALAPNARGGWNFIQLAAPEWIVMRDLTDPAKRSIISNLETGPAIYARGSVADQVRAPNGRIFFRGTRNTTFVYDPVDEDVRGLPPVVEDPPIDPHVSNIIYSQAFNQDGFLLVQGTQESQRRRCAVIVTDPLTLSQRLIAYVGDGAQAYTTYAYYLAVDTMGSRRADGSIARFVYVAFGQDPWQLWSVDLDSGATVKLAETPATATATSRISFQQHPEGWVADINHGDGTHAYLWCIDGKTYPYVKGASVPFKPRTVTPYKNPITNPPDLDLTGGADLIGWRAHGTTSYEYVECPLKHAKPIRIEGLAAVPDGVMGNVEQYQGFFQATTAGKIDAFDPCDKISQGARISVDGQVFAAGYPNGVLLRCDPKQAWPPNPTLIGYYGAAGKLSNVKYVDYLAWSPSRERLFMSGSRERSGTGGSVGWWERSTGTFGGIYAGLETVLPTGMALIEDGATTSVVVATRNIDDSPAARLFVFDQDLALLSSDAPFGDVPKGLGRLFPRSDGSLVGVVDRDGGLGLYTIDPKTFRTSPIVAMLQGAVGAMTQHPNGAVVVVVGTSLVLIPPSGPLQAHAIADVTQVGGISVLSFDEDAKTLFLAASDPGSQNNVDGSVLWALDGVVT